MTTTPTSTRHSGLDELDARRTLTSKLADLLAALNQRQEPDRNDCAGTLDDSAETALAEVRSRLTHLTATHPDLAQAARVDLGVMRVELNRAINKLDGGRCGHRCPEIPHDWVTTDQIAVDLLDHLTAAGYQLVRGPR